MKKPDINDYCGYHQPTNDPHHLIREGDYMIDQNKYIEHLERKFENLGIIGRFISRCWVHKWEDITEKAKMDTPPEREGVYYPQRRMIRCVKCDKDKIILGDVLLMMKKV